MKSLSPFDSLKTAAKPRSDQGSALIIVLSCMVFITVLMLAFFTSVTTERKSAVSYANSSSAKLLADSTIDVVIGQIKDATKGVDIGGGTLAWASQPGMIRTFDETGQPSRYYKLYSWGNMIEKVPYNPIAATETPPANWMSNPALYTDLNDPVSGVYPIVDPTAGSDPVTGVKGFKITTAPVSPSNLAPMPVQWLYMLQDGRIASATPGTGKTVSVALASTNNPIVGRVAFWTDDDTAKVNINTAAGDVWATSTAPAPGTNPGSFWDTPRTFSNFEKTYLAKYQPGKNEYQRFPGHPATTYLSAVFPTLTTADIYNISPRVALGGSKSGTAVASLAPVITDNTRLYASVDELLFAGATIQDPAPNPRVLTSSLTPSLVEKAKFFLTAHSRAPEVNLRNQPRVTIWPLNLTPAAPSPGTTTRTAFDSLIAACGTLNTKAFYFQRSSSLSQIIDLPATASATDTGLKRNRLLISYLRNLTSLPIPGFSNNASETFLNKYPTDRDQILTEIFDYIRVLNSQDASVAGLIPFSVTSTAIGSLGIQGQGQILPIIDTIHSDSNTETLRGFGRFPTVREATLLFVGVGQTKGAVTVPMPASNPKAISSVIPDGFTRVQAVFFLTLFDPSQGYALSAPDFKIRVSQLNGFQWNGVPMGFGATGTVTMIRNYASGNYGGYKGAATFFHGSGFNGAASAFYSTPKDLPTTGLVDPATLLPVSTNFGFVGGDVKVEVLDSAGTTVLQTLTINFPSENFPVPQLAPLLNDPGGPNPPYDVDYRKLDVPAALNGSLGFINGRFAGSGTNTGGTTSTKMWACGKDVIRSVVANTDPRLIAARAVVPASMFGAIQPEYSNTSVKQIHAIAEALNGGSCYVNIGTMLGKFVRGADYGAPGGTGSPAPMPAAGADLTYTGTFVPVSGPDGLQPKALPVAGGLKGYPAPIAFGVVGGQASPVDGVYTGTNKTGNTMVGKTPGDWDTGFGEVNDGAFINKADEGNINNLASGSIAYFEGLANYTGTGGTFFSPNRQMPSAAMFGSLPTGVFANRPWQTLLFRPDPGGAPQHTGAQSPPDHLLLDLFTMPVVEPYAISDPFSTAGKINMNYQIIPFTYITRDTGLRAVLRSEQILALGNSDAATYKVATFANRRNFLDLDETLKGFEAKFASGDIFRSASEICTLWLVPQGQTYAGMAAFWNNNLLTGDNVRERPYANIYPRLTTKSNTYTVHYRVQTLKKSNINNANYATWVEGTDTITGEYRGSSVIERYLDTASTDIPDYATTANPDPIDKFYKFRVVETRQFTP